MCVPNSAPHQPLSLAFGDGSTRTKHLLVLSRLLMDSTWHLFRVSKWLHDFRLT